MTFNVVNLSGEVTTGMVVNLIIVLNILVGYYSAPIYPIRNAFPLSGGTARVLLMGKQQYAYSSVMFSFH